MTTHSPAEFQEHVTAYWTLMQRVQNLFQRAAGASTTKASGTKFVTLDIITGIAADIISWVNPGPEHAENGVESYMNEGPLAALDAIEVATGEKKINILGFCIGGIPVTVTRACLAAKTDTRIASATTLATMVDLTDVGEIGVFIDDERLIALREHMAETGTEHTCADLRDMNEGELK